MPPQPPAVMAAMYVLGGVVLCVLTLGPLVWFLAIRRLALGETVLSHEPRREATWGLIDLVVAFGLLILLTIVGATITGLLGNTSGNQSKLYLIAVGAAAQILASVATACFIAIRTGCSPKDLGFSLADLGRDLKLGGAAFCALAIPTYGLQLILVQFWKSAHPLIESLKVDPDPQFLAIAMFAAVISAPLTEEFAFRVLFQGWLEKLFDPSASRQPNFVASLLTGERVGPEPLLAEVVEETPGVRTSDNPDVASPQSFSDAMVPVPMATFDRPAWVGDMLPILISSAVFALLHWSHGPDWIPLFVLALGLGYLYRRTHRVTPSLVVHFLLNLASMIALCVEIYQVKPK